MKKVTLFLCVTVLISGVVGINGTAHADNWFLSPGAEQIDTSVNLLGDQVTVDLYFNYTGGMSVYFTVIILCFDIDLAEITPTLEEGVPKVIWHLDGWSDQSPMVEDNIVMYAGGNLGGYNTWAMGNNLVSTMYLDLVNPPGPWDGDDFTLRSQPDDFCPDCCGTGLRDYYGLQISYAGAPGPDYGISIPGAAWLFGSFVIALLGVRRRFRKA